MQRNVPAVDVHYLQYGERVAAHFSFGGGFLPCGDKRNGSLNGFHAQLLCNMITVIILVVSSLASIRGLLMEATSHPFSEQIAVTDSDPAPASEL